MINQNFVILGVFIQFLGSFPYIKETIQGKIQPNKVTWFLWAVAPLVAFAAEISQGVGILSLATFMVGFVPLIVFGASFLHKGAAWKLSYFDMVCGFLSIVGILLWYITRVGNLAILFSIFADLLAAVPTIVKSYHFPESENATIYLFGIINAGVAILAVQTWNFESYGFPIYLLFNCVLLSFLIISKIGKRR